MPLADPAWLHGEVELTPGQRITLEPLAGRARGTIYTTRIEQVDVETVYVQSPIARLEVVSIPLGTPIRLGLRFSAQYFGFDSSIVEHVFHPQFLLGLDLPEVMQRRNERKHYRLPAAILPEDVRLLNAEGKPDRPVRATIINLSGGGIELVAPDPLRSGQMLSVRFMLEGAPLSLLAQVIDVEPPTRGRFNSRAHCQFLQVDRRTREKIVRYVFRRQVDLLRRGMLNEAA